MITEQQGTEAERLLSDKMSEPAQDEMGEGFHASCFFSCESERLSTKSE